MDFKVPDSLRDWCVLSCPVTGLRFDARTLELLDADGDGHVRSGDITCALDFLAAHGVTVDELFTPDETAPARLADVLSRLSDLERLEPSELERAALADWESRGASHDVAVLGERTAAAEAALAAVEKTVDAFFTPADDLPLVTEEPEPVLPLGDHLNPKYADRIEAFAEACVTPVLGARTALSRRDYLAVKAALAPYRAWVAAKPVANADAKAALVEDERLLRYRMNLGELLVNFVTMDRLYGGAAPAVFQTGVLRLDGKELFLCFHVEDEAAHAALAEKSKCCVVYAKLRRPSEKAERTVCAVVTAGTVGGLYVGRNGVFYDRDGKSWEATVTRVIAAQVSLAESFWAPWRKLGETVTETVRKFLGDRQTAAMASAAKVAAAPASGGTNALAGSVAAVGIGVGMAGAACASVVAAVRGMGAWQMIEAVAALILAVSLPSVILTYFKLRVRDLGAILNASGWAVNREMRFSMKLARSFTVCRPTHVWGLVLLAVVLALGLAASAVRAFGLNVCNTTNTTNTKVAVCGAQEVQK